MPMIVRFLIGINFAAAGSHSEQAEQGAILLLNAVCFIHAFRLGKHTLRDAHL